MGCRDAVRRHAKFSPNYSQKTQHNSRQWDMECPLQVQNVTYVLFSQQLCFKQYCLIIDCVITSSYCASSSITPTLLQLHHVIIIGSNHHNWKQAPNQMWASLKWGHHHGDNHWQLRVFMMPTLLWMAALDVVMASSSSTTSDDKDGIMTTPDEFHSLCHGGGPTRLVWVIFWCGVPNKPLSTQN